MPDVTVQNIEVSIENIDLDDIDGLETFVQDEVASAIKDGMIDFFDDTETASSVIQEVVEQCVRSIIKADVVNKALLSLNHELHEVLVKNNYAILGAAINVHKEALGIKVDNASAPKNGLEYIQKLHGDDGYLVVQIVDQIKGNINVMRLLIGEYKYYVQFCIAVGIDLDTYSRIHDHFKVQVKQELEGTDYVDDDAVRLAIANAKPIEVNNDE